MNIVIFLRIVNAYRDALLIKSDIYVLGIIISKQKTKEIKFHFFLLKF